MLRDQRHCVSRVFPGAPEPTPGGAGSVTLLPVQATSQSPPWLNFVLFPLSQLILL